MSKTQFKKRWDSDANGGGITFDDIADCAVVWGVCSRPKTRPIEDVADAVLKAAGVLRAPTFERTFIASTVNPTAAMWLRGNQ